MPLVLSYKLLIPNNSSNANSSSSSSVAIGKIKGVIVNVVDVIAIVTGLVLDESGSFTNLSSSAAASSSSSTSKRFMPGAYVECIGDDIGIIYQMKNEQEKNIESILTAPSKAHKAEWALVLPPPGVTTSSNPRLFRADERSEWKWVEDKIEYSNQQMNIRDQYQIVQCQIRIPSLTNLEDILSRENEWRYLFPDGDIISINSQRNIESSTKAERKAENTESMSDEGSIVENEKISSQAELRKDNFRFFNIQLLRQSSSQQDIHGIRLVDINQPSVSSSISNSNVQIYLNCLTLSSLSSNDHSLLTIATNIQQMLKNQARYAMSKLSQVSLDPSKSYALCFLSFTLPLLPAPNVVSRLLEMNDKGIYRECLPDDIAKAERRMIHEKLLLPTTRPFFRLQASNEIESLNETKESSFPFRIKTDDKQIKSSSSTANVEATPPLISPHIVPSTGRVVERKQTLKGNVLDIEDVFVSGPYQYYHYMMQNVNDKGWGCAYRSLQTIMSWFYLNHFTNVEPLSIRDIQSALVSLGVESSSFVGSKKWIGSQEVGWILDDLLGVSCSYVSCASADDIIASAGKMVDHFKNNGSPILLTGNNLALTILGIAWNKKTREALAFLILDPHYTGPDNLNDIQNLHSQMEGYSAIPCGWRIPSEMNFSKQGTTYMIGFPMNPQNVICRYVYVNSNSDIK